MRPTLTTLAPVVGACLALLGCGSEAARTADAPGSEPGSDDLDELAAKPFTPPPPTCQVAVNDLVFRLTLRNQIEARDGLVGECVDAGWSAAERRCVKNARSAADLRNCRDVQTTLILGSDSDGVALGIADCDRVIDKYRRCIPRALPPDIASDTQEALGLTLAEWRRRIAANPDSGWRVVQRECNKLIAALSSPMRRYGCAR